MEKFIEGNSYTGVKVRRDFEWRGSLPLLTNLAPSKLDLLDTNTLKIFAQNAIATCVHRGIANQSSDGAVKIINYALNKGLTYADLLNRDETGSYVEIPGYTVIQGDKDDEVDLKRIIGDHIPITPQQMKALDSQSAKLNLKTEALTYNQAKDLLLSEVMTEDV